MKSTKFAPRAAERLQAAWDMHHPDEPRQIAKLLGRPRSAGAAGWRWFALKDGEPSLDLGYTEAAAGRAIASPDSLKLKRANARLTDALDKLEAVIKAIESSPRVKIEGEHG